MFAFGPLHENRFEIYRDVAPLLKTGDILYRASDAKGPLGLPFSRLVARLTDSDYSHAAMVYLLNGEVYVLEINDQGTLKMRFIDWLDTCFTDQFSVYRIKNQNKQVEESLVFNIELILEKDPSYDFTFLDPDKFYCTEAVAWCCEKSGRPLDPPIAAKDVVKPWVYQIIRGANYLFSLFGTSFPVDTPLYFVGNTEKGMMASENTELLIDFKLNQ